MATYLYVNADQAKAAFGNSLGCGWVHEVPAPFADVAQAPCVILAGAGRVVTIADDGTLTPAKVQTAAQPILTAEQTAAALVTALADGDAVLAGKLLAAITANGNDVTQDQTIQTQAATITAASITNLTAAAAAIAKLAQAVSLLAGNDVNTKKQLTALERRMLGQTNDTSGT